MLKISQLEGGEPAILKLEGRLIGPWVKELENACAEHLAKEKRLRLDLADVLFADRSGIALLLRLRSQGISLNCSPFLDEELRIAPDELDRAKVKPSGAGGYRASASGCGACSDSD